LYSTRRRVRDRGRRRVRDRGRRAHGSGDGYWVTRYIDIHIHIYIYT